MLLEHERYSGLGMDALVTVCSWNTNIVMVWAWVLWSPHALETRTLFWFGHGCCSGHCLLLERERCYGLGMDALVTVCSNTNIVMVWAGVLWSPHALETRTLFWFGHGVSGHRMLFEHEHSHDLGMTKVIIVWACMPC